MSDKQVIVITGASSGFGNLAARALARAGHVVYAGMRATADRNAPACRGTRRALPGRGHRCARHRDGRTGPGFRGCGRGADRGRAGPPRRGGPQCRPHGPRSHRGVHPGAAGAGLRRQRALDPAGQPGGPAGTAQAGLGPAGVGGVLLHPWCHPPFLAPYFAAKAGMDALAESYAAELIKFGVDTVIVVPARTPAVPTTSPTPAPRRTPSVPRSTTSATAPCGTAWRQALADIFPAGRTADEVAEAIVDVVDLPAGRRPFRVHVDRARTAARSSPSWPTASVRVLPPHRHQECSPTERPVDTYPAGGCGASRGTGLAPRRCGSRCRPPFRRAGTAPT